MGDHGSQPRADRGWISTAGKLSKAMIELNLMEQKTEWRNSYHDTHSDYDRSLAHVSALSW